MYSKKSSHISILTNGKNLFQRSAPPMPTCNAAWLQGNLMEGLFDSWPTHWPHFAATIFTLTAKTSLSQNPIDGHFFESWVLEGHATSRHEIHETCHSVMFYFMKKTHFLILAGSALYQTWLGLVNQSQFSPKVKASADSRLLSSLVWIDSGVVASYHC